MTNIYLEKIASSGIIYANKKEDKELAKKSLMGMGVGVAGAIAAAQGPAILKGNFKTNYLRGLIKNRRVKDFAKAVDEYNRMVSRSPVLYDVKDKAAIRRGMRQIRDAFDSSINKQDKKFNSPLFNAHIISKAFENAREAGTHSAKGMISAGAPMVASSLAYGKGVDDIRKDRHSKKLMKSAQEDELVVPKNTTTAVLPILGAPVGYAAYAAPGILHSLKHKLRKATVGKRKPWEIDEQAFAKAKQVYSTILKKLPFKK